MFWIMLVDIRNGCKVYGPALSQLLAARSDSTASMRIVGLDTFTALTVWRPFTCGGKYQKRL